MKYGIWRHENALGNSAEHTVGLAKHLHRTKDPDPHIYVETEFQKYFAMCIDGITSDRIHKFEDGIFDGLNTSNLIEIFNERLFSREEYKDIMLPEVYAYNGHSYPAMWYSLKDSPEVSLKFPFSTYNNKFDLPEDSILIQIRERNTYWKRVDGADCEPERSVDKNTFFKIALHYADLGYKVIRIGDKNQTPMPHHENIRDFAMYEDRNMLDDLYLVATSKVFLSCDSGIWPMAGGLKKNLVLSNVASARNKMDIVDWLPKETTRVLFKHDWIRDNTFDELKTAVDSFL